MVNKRGQIYERNVRHAYLFLRRHFGSRSTVIPSPRGQDLSFSRWRRCYKSRGSILVSCRGSAKAVQCPCPGPKIGDKSQQIPRYSPVCPRGHPPGMAADKCIINNYSPKWRWLVVDIYRAAKRRGKYPTLATDTEVNSCFSIY